jgi:hypothetical protein
LPLVVAGPGYVPAIILAEVIGCLSGIGGGHRRIAGPRHILRAVARFVAVGHRLCLLS